MPDYELVVVGVKFAAVGPPAFDLIEALAFHSLAWEEELSEPPTLNASVTARTLPPVVKAALTDFSLAPPELWLYRDARLRFTGPLRSAVVQGPTATLIARGALDYTNEMVVHTSLTFTQVDQTLIGKALVDHWQDWPVLGYGHFGIDTGHVTASGVLRDRSYPFAEGHYIGQRLRELGAVTDGFDIAVDPASRRLELSYPRAGIDRSDTVVLDDRNIAEGDVAVAYGVGDLASYWQGAGTTDKSGSAPLVASFYYGSRLARVGRRGGHSNHDGVSDQSTLNRHLIAQLDARRYPLLVPSPKIIPVADADPDDFDVGDSVGYVFDAGVGLQVGSVFDAESAAPGLRVVKRVVTVGPDGGEEMGVQFS